MKYLCLILLMQLIVHTMTAQNQVVLIKHDGVVIRYQVGDDFTYKRKSSKRPSTGFVVAINDSTIITNNDTVATYQIERIYFAKKSFLNVVGGLLVTAGVGIFIIDQVNTIIVSGQDPSLDSSVSTISLTSIAVGLPMLLLTKNSHRVGFKQRLRIINRTSPFYYSDSRF